MKQKNENKLIDGIEEFKEVDSVDECVDGIPDLDIGFIPEKVLILESDDKRARAMQYALELTNRQQGYNIEVVVKGSEIEAGSYLNTSGGKGYPDAIIAGEGFEGVVRRVEGGEMSRFVFTAAMDVRAWADVCLGSHEGVMNYLLPRFEGSRINDSRFIQDYMDNEEAQSRHTYPVEDALRVAGDTVGL